MRHATAAAAAAIALILTGCAGVGVAPVPSAPAVTVARAGDHFTAEYRLDRDAPVWAFRRSALDSVSRQPWRPRQWIVDTPGVVMERHGHLDVLRAVDGGPVPRTVRLTLRPAAVDPEADYDPALIFTDGSVAMFAGHFDIMPLDSVEAAAALPLDLDEAGVGGPEPRITWRDPAGPVLIRGERRRDPISTDGGLYVLFGEAGLVDSPQLATVIDPQLPGWISAEIGDFAPQVAGYYARRLGPGETAKPTVMMSWTGPTPGVTSMGGSVLSGLIVMTFEGDGVIDRSAEVGDMARWFIGHESAHFWLGQTVGYAAAREAWITEGGADLMAIRALAALQPSYDARRALQDEVDECAGLAVRSVSTANTRGEHRAYYACGAVFAMAAEAAQKKATGGDWFDFLKPLIDASRTDRVLSRDEWLTALTQVSGDPGLRLEVERLLDAGAAEPHAAIARLFDRSGVAYRMDGGKVRLA